MDIVPESGTDRNPLTDRYPNESASTTAPSAEPVLDAPSPALPRLHPACQNTLQLLRSHGEDGRTGMNELVIQQVELAKQCQATARTIRDHGRRLVAHGVLRYAQAGQNEMRYGLPFPEDLAAIAHLPESVLIIRSGRMQAPAPGDPASPCCACACACACHCHHMSVAGAHSVCQPPPAPAPPPPPQAEAEKTPAGGAGAPPRAADAVIPPPAGPTEPSADTQTPDPAGPAEPSADARTPDPAEPAEPSADANRPRCPQHNLAWESKIEAVVKAGGPGTMYCPWDDEDTGYCSWLYTPQDGMVIKPGAGKVKVGQMVVAIRHKRASAPHRPPQTAQPPENAGQPVQRDTHGRTVVNDDAPTPSRESQNIGPMKRDYDTEKIKAEYAARQAARQQAPRNTDRAAPRPSGPPDNPSAAAHNTVNGASANASPSGPTDSPAPADNPVPYEAQRNVRTSDASPPADTDQNRQHVSPEEIDITLNQRKPDATDIPITPESNRAVRSADASRTTNTDRNEQCLSPWDIATRLIRR